MNYSEAHKTPLHAGDMIGLIFDKAVASDSFSMQYQTSHFYKLRHKRPMKLFFAIQALLLALAVTLSPCQAATADTPNVLLIIVDDLGFADLGCLGSEDLKTPHIDDLFKQSLHLEKLYANCPVCSPTRASVLTGCYPDRVGVPGVIRTHAENNWGNFTPLAKTLPQLLSDKGYFTQAIGKWHLGLTVEDHPMQHGFNSFHGFLGDMMDDYFHHRRHGNNYMMLDNKVIDPKGHATDLFSHWAADWITERNSDHADQPWFLYLAYNAPHTPIQPPKSWLQKVRERQPELPEARAKLVALIEHMDAGIGQVLDAIEHEKMARDTVVIFTSDNGGQIDVGANNGPLRDGKQSMYEGGLRIPGCIKVPGRTKPGSRTDTLCTTADFLPTIADLLDIERDPKLDGVSLLPVIENPEHSWPEREVYFVRREGGKKYAGLTIESIIVGDLKLVHNLPTHVFELYDLKNDPYETKDISKLQPKNFATLLRRLQYHIQRGGKVPWQ